MLSSKNNYISLVRFGIGHSADFSPKDVDWNDLKALAMRQGLSAVLLDGLEKIPENQRPSKEIMLQWIGEVLQDYDNRYRLYQISIANLAGFYRKHNLKMMVLKGYACGLDWPKPAHRPCGDIDIWLFGNQKRADELLSSGKNVSIDKSHHHHTVFSWNSFTVENHYDFVNVHAHRSSAELEKIFKKLGQDDTHFTEVEGERVYLPSPNLHALFLIRHMVSHFAAAEISLRQVLDWSFFIEKHTMEIDWDWLLGLLEKYHMNDFLKCINGVCVDDLGFDARLFPMLKYNTILKERVLADIIEPAYETSEPESFINRQLYRLKRWQENAWKQKLCYDESRWTMFWNGVWNHLLKPASI